MSVHTVHCGGHITLLFSIWKDARLARFQGSRGAGFNVIDGVEATIRHIGTNEPSQPGVLSEGAGLDELPVEAKDGEIRLEVTSMDGTSITHSTNLYTDLIEGLRGARLLNRAEAFNVEVTLGLPTSQGFGMSAAGLVAVARAFHLHSGIGKDDQYLRIAHRIERLHSGGLGDVLGIAAGGVELRLEAGAPGAGGKAVGFETDQPILLIWKPDESRHTSNYIDDEKWQLLISNAGEMAVQALRLKEWGPEVWPDLMLQARHFAQVSKLLDEEERNELNASVMDELRRLNLHSRVYVRLCMLGVSLAILPRNLSEPLTGEEISVIANALRELQLGVRSTFIQG